MPAFITRYLDQTSMYRVVLFSLSGLIVCALALSLGGLLSYSISELLVSLTVISVTALAVSWILAKVSRIPAQHLSTIISAQILFFLLIPTLNLKEIFVLAFITFVVIASKYVIVYRRQHIFNPVAIGLVITGWLGVGGAGWWVATPVLFIPLLLLGWLVVIKVRRLAMVLVFLLTAFAVYLFTMWQFGLSLATVWPDFWLSYPALFLACFMLTEPFTMPGTKRLQIIYGLVVGFLLQTALFSNWFVMTPELALVIGNALFFPWTVRQKLLLTLREKVELAPQVFKFIFAKPEGLKFAAGQYMEWMLPHQARDARGARRYFTIASSPQASELVMIMKVPKEASTYKQALLSATPGTVIRASQVAGDFILPKDPQTKIGWIAGGIGITPFMSQADWLSERSDHRDIVLFYSVKTATDAIPLATINTIAKVVPVVEQGDPLPGGESGFVSGDIIQRRAPDYQARIWYVSGPPPMVKATKKALRSLGVPRKQIREDFFPGLA